MSIQQPATVQLGEFGEDMAAAFFSMIGWGPLRTGRQDLGTDVFVQLRTDELVDLRMLLGVQVKTGGTWFSTPATVEGRSGWWYRENDKRHAEYWKNHHVPHILVLQSEDMSTRVWAVLDSNTIEDTGQGIRVFVPDDQILDATWKPRWIDLVSEARKLLSFEGSRWNFSISQVPEDARLRYAMLVPRLVAPHPNRGASAAITWTEAIASCISGDPRTWARIAHERADVPGPTEAATHEELGWRTAGAIYQWVFGEDAGLASVHEESTSQPGGSAIAICRALTAIDRYELENAASYLELELRHDDLDADQVWLRIHLAQIQRLRGETASARSMLEEALITSAGLAYDITTSALRSACVLGLFELAPLLQGDVAAAVTAADNSSAWWRTQSVASGLESYAKKSFKKWARDKSITFGGEGAAHNSLHSAAMTARLAGDFGGWRGYASLLAQTDLVSPPDESHSIANSLDSLRSVGDKANLRLALSKVLHDGPMHAVAELADRATPENSTSASIAADLALLNRMGSHLSHDQARAWISLLLQALVEPQQFYDRFAIRNWAFHDIAAALSGLVRHLNVEDQASLLTFAKSLPAGTSQLLEAPLTELLHEFDAAVIDEHLGGTDIDAQPTAWLAILFRDLLAPRSEEARLAVRAALEAGDLGALSGAADATTLESGEATVVLDHCESAFEKFRQPTNGLTIGGDDPYRLAIVLALHGPADQRERAWRLVTTALADNVDVQERKHAAFEIITEHPHQVPVELRGELIAGARAARGVGPSQYWRNDGFLNRIEPVATATVLALDTNAPDWEELFATLIAGDPDSRRYACIVMAHFTGYDAMLTALTRDPDRAVAARAARALAKRAAINDDVSPAYLSALVQLMRETGEALPFAVLSGVAAATARTSAGDRILDALAEHASPNVRSVAAEVKARLV
ncbi:DUF4365 domain-containing protein [Microbacterium sp. Root280D1]|uniref:DUF4365 domain-containing protein n=1 Tax=Microbacterium sp. Root280D1 TaxID=1736510 RepID=UPI0006F85B00|nr:DUF4365 domain-containing protein [Microbacterium sp. Root280D1]KRD50556.1 hypothetical protein ASE34_13480 [Microbacterium sp. Root280D1]